LEKYSLENRPIIILIEPQLGENIGSAARAMKNFNLHEMRIVNPRDGWPNAKANQMAAHAIDVIHNAVVYKTLVEAISDLEYLYATTVRPRDINKELIISKDINTSYPYHLKTGIMFGRENSGLTNVEISNANKIITINTIGESSLNIAQAIVIICYELSNNDYGLIPNNFIKPQPLATKGELMFFFNHLFIELDKKKFFRVPQKKAHMIKNISNIFTRLDNLTKTELQILRGIITALTLR
jgi:tRNA/rRNA methyltransferase